MSNTTQSIRVVNEPFDRFFARCEEVRRSRDADWCCLAIDIEHFRLFNELYGREQGDALLGAYADTMTVWAQEHGAVAVHLGRDDFAVFAPYDLSSFRQLLNALKQPIKAVVDTVGFQPAFGVYRLAADEAADLGVYDKAIEAMQAAKQDQSDRIRVYDAAAHAAEQNEYQILTDLKEAVARGEITFFLQPQCHVSSKRIVGAEALARWVRADGSMVSPGVFIPVLERKGFIADFDRRIWEQVYAWLRSLMDRGMEPVPVSINVSRTDIQTLDVVEFLCSLCEKYRVPARLVKVEITESSYAEDAGTVRPFVERLKENGFLVMMDDFGSGYSSLNMLENIAVDVLKLDMIFMKDANLRSRKGVTIVESIVNMAKMMGLPIVVEGVETAEQVQFLRDLGCRYAQGYHFYRPMPIAQFEALMTREDMLDHRGFVSKRNDQFHVREFIDENTFTDCMLNNILGAVAFYALDGRDLTITRFNEQFYRAIGDGAMETRQVAIQNYIVREDWPTLYRTLDDAYANLATGSTCEIRFYKSDGGVFWFRLHFFYLKNEAQKRIYYGQVEDVTELRQQSIQLFEVLRDQAAVSMLINLDQRRIQYVTSGNSLSQLGLPSVDLEMSTQRTAESRIEDEEARRQFIAFFNVERLRDAHRRAVYHETLTIPFRMHDQTVPMTFSTYYIRYSKEQELNVYVFARYA